MSVVLLAPKPAQGFLGIGDISVTVGDIPRAIERIILGILREVAFKITDKFIARFVNKMTEKYKIKNILYYDRVLSNYYLNRFIFDKISDPDLRQIYTLMEKAFITGKPTGTSGQPDPRRALIPQINAAIAKEYKKRGGIDPNKIYNPKSFKTDREYFSAAQSYFLNPKSFTEQNLRGEFGSFQSSSTTAAQIEVLIGNGIKAGRVIGGTCSNKTVINPTPETCEAAGGKWQPSALDKARSFIDNPSNFIKANLDGFIKREIDTKFDPNNFWIAIGSLVGSFLWNKFALNKSGGPLEEAPAAFAYQPEGNTQLDIDNDRTPDGYDVDDDGDLDICFHGGTAPNCTPSSAATNSPYYTPLCQSVEFAVSELEKYLAWVQRTQFAQSSSGTWLNKSVAVNGAVDEVQSTIVRYDDSRYDIALDAMGKYVKFMTKVIASLAKDEDLDFGLGSSNEEVRDSIISNTTNMLNYLQAFRGSIIQCDNPDVNAIGAIPPPNIDPGDDTGGGFIECDTPPDTISPDPMSVMLEVQNEFPGLDLANEDPGGGRDQFTAIVAYRLWLTDSKWGRKRSGPSAPISTDTLGYLRPDIGPARFEAVDLIAGGSGALQRGCYGVVGSGQVWVQPPSAP